MANKQPSPPAFNWFGFLLLITGLILFSQLGVRYLTAPAPIVAEIISSDLDREIEAGNIKTIKLEGSGYISGEFKNPVQGAATFKVNGLPLSASDARFYSEKIRSKDPATKIEVVPQKDSTFLFIILQYAPMILIFVFLWVIISRATGGGAGSKINHFGKSKAKLAPNGSTKATFADVQGIDEAKEELMEVVEFLKNPAKFSQLGAKIPKGVLLVGPAGTGKTLLARAVAGEAKVPFFSISGSDFVEMFVGVGASRVRDLFEQGKKNAPCIIFIDELDAVAKHRGTGLGNSHDEREQTLNQMLVEMDGFEGNTGVIIIGATNRPDVLDPAMLRPGRFDRQVVVHKPDVKGRFEILKVHARKFPLNSSVDLQSIARGTSGFTGADLANLLNEAAIKAAGKDRKEIISADLEEAKDKVLMGAEKRSMVISDKEKETTAVHEAGHTVLAVKLPNAHPIHKVTIIPRGMSMGSTWQLPAEDQHNYSKKQLEAELAILMGGRVAEELFLDGQLTTGASNDFKRAKDLAKRMVREWGMSKTLGPLTFGEDDTLHPFLGKGLPSGTKDYSEETAQKIDFEIREFIMTAYNTAKETLSKYAAGVKEITRLLLEKEVLDSEEILRVLNEP